MGYDYVPRLTDVGMRSSNYYSVVPSPWGTYLKPLNWYPSHGHPGNCTSYCVGRWWEICSGDTSKMRGLLSERSITGTWNGGAWYVCSPQLQAGTSNPQPGDIACWSRGQSWAGHVAVVEEVHADYCVMSQSEYSGKYFNVTTNYAKYAYTGQTPTNYYKRNGYIFRGFIRMKDVPSPPTIPDFDMPTEWVHYPSYLSMTEEDRQNNAIMAAVQLYSYGWTLEAIAGALGNFEAESNIDPQATGTGGGGLVGWTPLSNYKTWSDYHGYTWYDGEKQIEFISMDVYCSGLDQDGVPILHPQWIPRPSVGMNIRFNEYIRMTDTPEQMTRYWMLCYERPLDQSAAAQLGRAIRGRKWYDFLLGMDFESPKRPYIHQMPIWMMAGNAKPKLIY